MLMLGSRVRSAAKSQHAFGCYKSVNVFTLTIHSCCEVRVVLIRKIMINEKLYLTDGSLFATKYNRVVHGGRGDYIELEKDHIVPELISKFGNDLNGTYDFYYL